MAAVSESRVSCLSDCWLYTPSQKSDNEDHSEHDSDYETDNEDVASKTGETIVNVQWTGYARKIPVMLFSVDALHKRKSNFKAIAEHHNLSFKFASTDCKIVRRILLSHGFIEAKPGSTEYNLLWSSSHLKPSALRFMADFQKINHFPRSCELTRKDRLFRNIQRMQLMKGYRHFDFIPASYVLPGDYQEFYTHFQKNKGLYIVKPVASSQGRGVFLVSHPEQVPLDEHVIVSKYISAPLVIDGFKFDVRCYVAVTSYDPLVIYMYEEGLTRFATVKYEKDMRYLRNQCMHLTNYSVNKRSEYYVRNSDPDVENFGNKWSMSAMLRHLRSTGKDTAALMMQIENIVIKTILCAESSIVAACKMYQPFRGNCYELYGFDILIDENLKPWVLEVNFSPSLACDSPLDLKIKSNMLCDLFSLIGVICQDPSTKRWVKSSRQRRTLDKTAGTLAASNLPVKSASEDTDMNIHMTGLNSEEIKILRRVKEEESRKGGWIRIFPSADSWDIYGHLLHFPNAHNMMLHQRLYSDRHKGTYSGKTTGTVTVKQSFSKNKIQLLVGKNGTGSQEKHREISASGLIRAKQYERKLKQMNSSLQSFPVKSSSAGGNENEEIPVSKNMRDIKLEQSKTQLIDVVQGKTGTEIIVSVKSPSSSPTVSSDSSTEDSASQSSQTPRENVAVGEPRQFHYRYLTTSKTDLLTLIQNGYKLSTVQARAAFAMYLVRVKERLLSDWSASVLHHGTNAANDQIELVLRFLKCAATDLPQTVCNIVPNKKLPIKDRKKVLAEQLGIFIGLYNKETEQMKARKMKMTSEKRKLQKSKSCRDLSEQDFLEFVSVARENELEAVLMAFAKSNKSSAVFLGGDSDVETDTNLEEDKDKQKYSSCNEQTRSHNPATFGAMGDTAEIKEANNLQAKVTSRVEPQHLLAHHRHHEYLCSGTAAIYTQKLGRPQSATASGSSRTGTNKKDAQSEKAVKDVSTHIYCWRLEDEEKHDPPSQSSQPSAKMMIEDAIHELNTKLQLLKSSHNTISIQKTAEDQGVPNSGYHPSSFADMSSTELPETNDGDPEQLMETKTPRKKASKIKTKHQFTLVGKSLRPLNNRKGSNGKNPEAESTLTTGQGSRS